MKEIARLLDLGADIDAADKGRDVCHLMLGNRKVTIYGSRFRISCMSKYARDTNMPSPWFQ